MVNYLRRSETIAVAAGLLLFLDIVVVRAASSDDVAAGCYGNDTGYPVCFSAYRNRGIALKSWSDASALCRGTFGGSLPLISSTRVQLRLAEFLYDNQFTVDSVWLGARGATSRSSNTAWRWVSGGGALPSSGVSGSDSSFNQPMAVITFDESGNASITARSTSYIANGYICQTKQQTPCVGDTADDHFGDGVNCFRRFDQPGNWFTSRNKCLYGNGDLATLDDTTTAGLNEVLEKLGYVFDSVGTKRNYWVGLTKLWWQWVPDSVEYNLTFFINEPSIENSSAANGNCLAADYRNQFAWTIRDCSIAFQTVCQTSELPTTNESSSSSSSSSPSSSSSVTLPVWAVGVIGGCAGLFYVVSLVVVAVIVCKCCRDRPTAQTEKEEEEGGTGCQRRKFSCSSGGKKTSTEDPVYEIEGEFDDVVDDYKNDIPPPKMTTAPPGAQYMNHDQANAALGPRRPR